MSLTEFKCFVYEGMKMQGLLCYFTGSDAIYDVTNSGGSRISRWGGADPLAGCQPLTHTLFGKNVRKMKEMDPVGGARGGPPLDPPMTNFAIGAIL